MPEVQDIFRLFGEEYRGKYNLPLNHYKVMGAIENCRTSNLGAHIDECMSCGYKKISYNSCRNRHCPKCQSFAEVSLQKKSRETKYKSINPKNNWNRYRKMSMLWRK